MFKDIKNQSYRTIRLDILIQFFQLKHLLLKKKNLLLNNISPRNDLTEFVRLYRIIDFSFVDKVHTLNPTKSYRPRIEHCLQFTPFDSEKVTYPDNDKSISKSVALVGQHTILNNRQLGNQFLNFQIVFQPGILAMLLKTPINELTNCYVNAEDYLGNSVNDINCKLALCNNKHEMILVIEEFLNSIFKHQKFRKTSIYNVAKHMIASFAIKPIEWYANQANMCYRQFDRVFKTETGVNPKVFQSLIKLDTAYLLKNRNPQQNWSSIALESGFYDYQHLSKNYLKYIGYTPIDFNILEQSAPERHFGDFEH